MSKNRLTNEKGQFTNIGESYLKKLNELATPIFIEMFENDYDISDIKVIREEFMRYEISKMMYSFKDVNK